MSIGRECRSRAAWRRRLDPGGWSSTRSALCTTHDDGGLATGRRYVDFAVSSDLVALGAFDRDRADGHLAREGMSTVVPRWRPAHPEEVVTRASELPRWLDRLGLVEIIFGRENVNRELGGRGNDQVASFEFRRDGMRRPG